LAELRVFSTIGVQIAVEELVPLFERASGHKLAVTWATAPMLVRRIQGGETADVLILNRAGIETLTAEGRIVAGSGGPVASSSIAMAVKAGASKPDISTAEAFKRTLLAAKSISYTDPAAGGASGIFIAKLLERWGIAGAVNAKNTFPPAGGYAATLLLTGEAELAIQQEPELMRVSGIELVGLLPAEANVVTEFVTGLAADCRQVEAARALLAFLHSPASARVFEARGLGRRS
jgi:molybdate transport system substrate-binding protein